MLASLRTAIAVLAAVVAIDGHAVPITYEFSVTATDGPLAGVTSNGIFTFDSASITPGGTNNAAGLFTDLDFTWNGITYDESNANTGTLTFDGAGELIQALFGNNCSAGLCGVDARLEQWLARAELQGGLFIYAITGGPSNFFGSVTLSRVSVVPEPASLALVGVALVIAVAFRRRKRSVAALLF